LRIKNQLKKFVYGWFPKEIDNVTATMKTITTRGTENQKKKPSAPLWFGLCFTFGFIFIFLTWIVSYRSLWPIMAGGAIIGLIFGSLIGIVGARIFTGITKKKALLGFCILAVSLIGMLFTGLISYLFWQEGYIESGLHFLLINSSFGFFASFFLAEGLTERHIRSHPQHGV
jgi:hypothetical protein